jgi:chromosome segregation ATPase
MNDQFAFLRPELGAGQVDDSFWPSFTDIMMVVVMIFLIATSLLIIRNWELLADLRASIEAEQMAAQMAQSATEENITLEERLAQAEHEISMLRLAMLQARELQAETEADLSATRRDLANMRIERDQLTSRLQSTERQLENVQAQYTKTTGELDQLRADYAQQGQRLESALTEVDSLTRIREEQMAEISALRQESALTAEELRTLQSSYDTLESKYEKLIKPARTAKGKFVVEVRYSKQDGDKVGYREPGQSNIEYLSLDEVEKRLTRHKARDPKSLYVKIIIPKDSGLSYSEAWAFMKNLLEKYDYYYYQQ